MMDTTSIDWDKGDGLVPAIIQDAATRQVLMLGYMNALSLEETIKTGHVHFFSRSKQRLWMKGESSGNIFNLVSVKPDCDRDALLVEVRPEGPACHTNTVSCFGDDPGPGLGFLAYLAQVIESRSEEKPEDSYVARLLSEAPKKPAQKVGEEGVEVAIAAVSENKQAVIEESADLLFHLMVLLKSRDLGLDDVLGELRKRHQSRADV